MSFITQLKNRWRQQNSLLCVGLDPDLSLFPKHLRIQTDAVFQFCKAIIDATAPYVCCFKPQIAHFSAIRAEEQLESIIQYIHQTYPDIPVILDAKRGDIGSTAEFYAKEAFERYRADAVTVNPYLGSDAVAPFFDYSDKGIILLCKTSNAGSHDLQNLRVGNEFLFEHVARLVSQQWNKHHNAALVVGATYPEELASVRRIVGDMPLLVPGIGAQGGDLPALLKAGLDTEGKGLIISSSRAILYASQNDDFTQAAEKVAKYYFSEINHYRTELMA